MFYLIDGYNLLFATGRLTPRAARGSLESSRKWLLVEIVRWHASESNKVTVVFDAAGAPPGTPTHEDHGDVRVLFARGQTADDLIEDLIRGESAPRTLTVISDDNRIKEAARRRGCVALGCLDYCEQWQQVRRPTTVPTSEPAKPTSISEDERRRWLEAFKDVEDDTIESI